jgi:N-hydroxyarylamine O-acetyltransferase
LNNLKIETPKTHRVVILKFKGDEYLLDVGFGAMTPSVPLKIKKNKKILQNYQITQDDNNFKVELLREKGLFSLYTFNLDTYTEADCKVGNFYSEYHEDAVFQNNLIISKKQEDRTLSFRNNSYHQISSSFTNILNIIDHKQLQNTLKKDFDIIITNKESKILFEKAEQFRIK